MPPAWILNATGLCIGVVAALLMFYYPPMLPRYTRDGRRLTQVVDQPTEQGQAHSPASGALLHHRAFDAGALVPAAAPRRARKLSTDGMSS